MEVGYSRAMQHSTTNDHSVDPRLGFRCRHQILSCVVRGEGIHEPPSASVTSHRK